MDNMDNFQVQQPGTGMGRAGPDPMNARPGDGDMQPFPGADVSTNRRSFIPADSSYPSSPPEPSYLPQRPAEASRHLRQQGSHSSSTLPIIAGAATPGSITPNLPSSDGSGQGFPLADYQSHQMPTAQYPYHDSPYQTSSLNFAPQVSQADINPQNIADDGDDGFIPVPKRKSVLGKRASPTNGAGPSAATGGAAATGGFMGALSGLAGRKQKAQTSSGTYDPVAQPGNVDHGGEGSGSAEKSEWLSRQTKGNNKMRWVVGFVIGLVIILAVVGGIVGGVLGSRAVRSDGVSGGPSGESINNADDDTAANGDLSKNSAEIKKLMNNADLHKVFPAIDYTPWGTQYPLCLTYPPSQNNITRDMAVLSQLTNTVRLYGTDCNQTEMVLHSIDRLELTSMKVWLGVWIEGNTTTNDRQLEKMYKILEDISDHSIFKGVIVGNEALYRAGDDRASSQQALIKILTEVKSNFTSLNYDLPVTTSDLGDNWDVQLVQAVDVVMSNIHPFFAGVPVEEAAGWTWSFWKNKNGPLVAGTDKPEVISETGWPSGGGNDCGTLETKCPTPESGSVAGADEMNIFMDDFVCQALDNGTDYFW
jgi:exo-beta-1,3-glucanase (GH17 family)